MWLLLESSIESGICYTEGNSFGYEPGVYKCGEYTLYVVAKEDLHQCKHAMQIPGFVKYLIKRYYRERGYA